MPDPVATVVDVVSGTTGGTSTPTGVGSVDSSQSGGVTVTVGQQSDGGSLATVHLGGSGDVGGSGGGSVPVPVPVPVDQLSDTTGTVTSTTTSTTTTGATTGTTTGTAAAPVGAPAGSAAHLLSLDVTPSLGTVYPVKDGYRDSVLFRLGALTSDGSVVPLSGTAVLRRGIATVARWTFTRSNQALRWDGRDHGRIRPGTYSMTVAAKDAVGAVFQDKAKVTSSAKRLVAATTRVSGTVISGTHTMAAAPRAGLARGPVTVVVETVASGVTGRQSLIFTKGRKRIVVPIRNGARISRTITVPKEFSSYRVSHTWKKGTVTLKRMRSTYSYQALR